MLGRWGRPDEWVLTVELARTNFDPRETSYKAIVTGFLPGKEKIPLDPEEENPKSLFSR